MSSDQAKTLLLQSEIIEKSSYYPPKLVKIDLKATQINPVIGGENTGQVS